MSNSPSAAASAAAPSAAPSKASGRRRCSGQAFVPSESSLPSNAFHKTSALECRNACEENANCHAWKWKDGMCRTFDDETMLVSRSEAVHGSLCRDETFAQPFDGFDAQSIGDAEWDESSQIFKTPSWTSSAAACAEACQRNANCRSFAYNSDAAPGVCNLLNVPFDSNSSHLFRKNGASHTITANRLPS